MCAGWRGVRRAGSGVLGVTFWVPSPVSGFVCGPRPARTPPSPNVAALSAPVCLTDGQMALSPFEFVHALLLSLTRSSLELWRFFPHASFVVHLPLPLPIPALLYCCTLEFGHVASLPSPLSFASYFRYICCTLTVPLPSLYTYTYTTT